MILKKFAAVLGGAMLLAGTATVGTATAAPAGASACGPQTRISSAEGYAWIAFCDGNTRVVGTVYDTKSDGRCPLVMGYLSGTGGTVNSNWAGPKGDNSPVDIGAAAGRTFVGAGMGYIRC
ncbi:hypothetical protein [Streptomyces sp. NPDC050848]|uniref:hypothetical protein n=1 Tax=Streptomyces sp. NPDC050848 TaxID=3155791 RepID=UPI0033CEEC5A